MGRLFGTDGIRGVANEYPLTAEGSFYIGRAAASFFQRPSRQTNILIGKDTRQSGTMIEKALADGICSVGADALLAGIIPTPAIASLVSADDSAAGIVISASHNPYTDNGIKLFDTEGYKRLLHILEVVERDTWQLFVDMHRYNDYAAKKRGAFMEVMRDINSRLENG